MQAGWSMDARRIGRPSDRRDKMWGQPPSAVRRAKLDRLSIEASNQCQKQILSSRAQHQLREREAERSRKLALSETERDRYPGSIRGRSAPFNGCHDDLPAFEHNFEQNSPVAYPTAEARKALQPTDVTVKRVLLHLRQSGQNARLVARWNPFKRPSCGTG